MKQVHIRVDELYEKLDRKKAPRERGCNHIYSSLFIENK